ncbi:MAG TPA: Re/Si-specific NAD(P)(+) transhydrogenase subunit alpha [Ktedonobacteraceae bacterium]|nr:Re/Si-specific NAD(P)(+) transhydrogenase subunit alpha [Ktedonobacteraceae bacterium]
MRIGIPKEVQAGETRVALIPGLVPLLIKDQHEVLVEAGAGVRAHFSDAQYLQAGAALIEDAPALYEQADMIFKVQPPQMHPAMHLPEAEMVREGSAYIGFLSPFTHLDVVETFARRKITAFAMEFVPRITRAQSMDALSSMSTVAGYKAVLLATEHLGKMFPLLMTAAGTIRPATVLVLGAGVAGLQAIATAKRLGAKVEAFDARPAVREQIQSLGATFIEMELSQDAEAAGGYAKEQSASFLKREQEVICARFPTVNVVISTAQVFGKRAPVLITTEMVKSLPPGSVIVDLAAEQGGNCELTQAGQTIDYEGVTIVGATNVPALLPSDASQLYAHNVVNLLRYLSPANGAQPESSDELVKGVCVTCNGEIVHPLLQSSMREEVSR